MDTEMWEPMMYRAKVGAPRKLVYWPHDDGGYWQLVVNDDRGIAQRIGHFASAEEAAASAD